MNYADQNETTLTGAERAALLRMALAGPLPRFDSLTLALPAHWLPALINGDVTSLDDAEYTQLARWELDMLHEFGPLMFELPEDAEPHFARYHDAAEYGVLACDCYDVTVWFHAEPTAT